jgi:hypothetical protein
VSALALAALAAVMLLAPATRYQRKPVRRSPGQTIRGVNGVAAGGLAAMGLAVSAAV